MVDSLEVRIACPSVSFLFARLGGSLGTYPFLENFVFEGNCLSVVLGDLLPLLRQSLNWFEGLAGRGSMSEVRSSDLETGLSSSDDPVEGDTAVSGQRVVRAFHALEEICGLDDETVNRFKDRFQFPSRVRVRLPREEDRACHFSPGEVCFYESSFTCGLRFPIHPFLMELLDHFGIAPGQLMPNSWRIVINCMQIWLASNGDMIRLAELTYLYRLKESREWGYYELVPWERKTRIVKGLPSSFRYWKSRFFFVSGDDFETQSSSDWGDVPRLLRRWGTPTLAKRRPGLKSRYKERIETAIGYAETIESWDELVDPRSLAFYNLGPDPSPFVLRHLGIEGKKKMTTKFNKDMYAKMRSKKDEPLSNLGKKVVRVTGQGSTPTPLSTLPPVALETTRTSSPTASIEEIVTPGSKRQRVAGKGKEKKKADVPSSTIWDDERLALDRAHEVVTPADLKALSDMSLNDVASRHVHKLVQVLGESLHITAEYITQEAKVASLTTRMEDLERENSDLKKNLITSMDEATSLKQKVKVLDDDLRVERQLTQEKDEQLLSAKEKLATVAARSVEAFQTTDEYNTVLFSWYFKGFELLRRYLVKHPTGVNMESLDLEEVDKEMALDEAAQSSAPDDDAPGPATDAPAAVDASADA